MTKPNLLLVMPAYANIYTLFQTNLIHQGFNLYSLIFNGEERLRYPSFTTWLNVKLQRMICRKDIKPLLKQELFYQNSLDCLNSIPRLDYALVIRPDLYSDDLLRHIKNKTERYCAAYQWDGMDRFKGGWDKIGFFDAFYVFDRHDLHNNEHRLRPASNFYFDYDMQQPEQPEFDCYFLGGHLDGRAGSIMAFAQAAKQNGWKLNVSVYCHLTNKQPLSFYRNIYPLENINITLTKTDFQENLNAMKNARVLLDVKTPDHHGLSFRPFEALAYRKKLITTNADIRHYDFYHPDNIFIWDGKNTDGLPEFMQKPYHEITGEIRKKYSFGNWINYVLDIEPHIKINLPATD